LETPCKNICELDQVMGLCTGCGRSLAEIASWRDMTPHDRRAIMTVLDARLEQVRLDAARAQ